MSRWFRLYDDAINDPKVLKLPEATRWHWIALLCVASKHGGILPTTDDVAICLRIKVAAAAAIIATLMAAGLLDEVDGRFVPHNWNGRQYKSDVSTERVKRHRKQQRNVSPTVSPTVSCNVSETPPETDTETETEQKDSEATASGAKAPRDPRTRLFAEGLEKLALLTGKGPDACRSFVGKCLKQANDDAIVVLGLIDEAERNRVANPSAWIVASLKGHDHGKTESRIIQAADDLRRKIAGFDGPPGGDIELRGGTGEAAARLLSHG